MSGKSQLSRALSLTGKTFLITGSTDGIGRHTATRLAADGATVILHGRNPDALEATQEDIIAKVPEAKLESYCHDLSTLSGMKALAGEVLRDYSPTGIDGLINNAGVFQRDFIVTEDGMEYTFALNVAAPFVLTCLLLPLLRSIPKSKILNVSSLSQGGKIDIMNLQFENTKYSAHSAYSLSKLYIAAFSRELAGRVSPDEALIMSCDPGTVDTKMLRDGWQGMYGIPLLTANDEYELITSEFQARDHGQYFVSTSPSRCVSDVYNDEKRVALWNELERLTDCTLPSVDACV